MTAKSSQRPSMTGSASPPDVLDSISIDTGPTLQPSIYVPSRDALLLEPSHHFPFRSIPFPVSFVDRNHFLQIIHFIRHLIQTSQPRFSNMRTSALLSLITSVGLSTATFHIVAQNKADSSGNILENETLICK
jgi:hypothetical protein